MVKKVKAKDYEKLDNANIARVIKLLSAEKPITKKEACQLLNISYNTTRLGNIIESYNSKIEFVRKRREQNKGKPVSEFEIKEIVQNYLIGVSKQQISDMLYRPLSTVNGVLNRYHIPERGKGDYRKPELIPDESLSENYEAEELAWSARYNTVVEITKLVSYDKEHGNIYRIWVFGRFNQFALQPWYELGKLDIVKRLGIKATDIQTDHRVKLEYNIA